MSEADEEIMEHLADAELALRNEQYWRVFNSCKEAMELAVDAARESGSVE